MLQSTVELEKLQGAMDLARAAACSKFEKDIDRQKASIDDVAAQLQTWYLVDASKPADRKSSSCCSAPSANAPARRRWSH